MKPVLKPPGTKRLKLNYGQPPSKLAFNFNLRRYTMVGRYRTGLVRPGLAPPQVGAYTRPLQSSTSGPSGQIAHIRAQPEHLRVTSTGYVGLYGGHGQLKCYMGDTVSLS